MCRAVQEPRVTELSLFDHQKIISVGRLRCWSKKFGFCLNFFEFETQEIFDVNLSSLNFII